MTIPTLPESVLLAITLLEQASFEAYLVGGGLRDSLLGLQSEDYDLTTDATPDEMKYVFSGYRIHEIGIDHGTLQVIIKGMPLEITTYRSDGLYLDHRHPQSVRFSRSLSEDLARRDFTVNAMAFHPKKGSSISMAEGKTFRTDAFALSEIRSSASTKMRFASSELCALLQSSTLALKARLQKHSFRKADCFHASQVRESLKSFWVS